jgi:hypothetical protein
LLVWKSAFQHMHNSSGGFGNLPCIKLRPERILVSQLRKLRVASLLRKVTLLINLCPERTSGFKLRSRIHPERTLGCWPRSGCLRWRKALPQVRELALIIDIRGRRVIESGLRSHMAGPQEFTAGLQYRQAVSWR